MGVFIGLHFHVSLLKYIRVSLRMRIMIKFPREVKNPRKKKMVHTHPWHAPEAVCLEILRASLAPPDPKTSSSRTVMGHTRFIYTSYLIAA